MHLINKLLFSLNKLTRTNRDDCNHFLSFKKQANNININDKIILFLLCLLLFLMSSVENVLVVEAAAAEREE